MARFQFHTAGKVFACLKQNLNTRFTAREIAEWILEHYPEDCREKQKRSTATVTPIDSESALLNQIVAEIGARRPQMQKQDAKLRTTEGRPRKYYYTEESEIDEVKSAESETEMEADMETAAAPSGQPKRREYDLYPLLTQFLFSELGTYSKRIDERRSSNKHGAKGNKWLYPDLVGMENLSQDWHREIKDVVKNYSDKKTKLWSFEVKLFLNRSNLRQAFFQAVSNSSWANYGYLVTGEIEGADTMKEFRILSAAHGIGLILLNTDNPVESDIKVPARERSEIDWDSANRVAEENKDFRDYIKLVRQFYQTGDLRPADWDKADIGDSDD